MENDGAHRDEWTTVNPLGHARTIQLTTNLNGSPLFVGIIGKLLFDMLTFLLPLMFECFRPNF